jgi:hypothetical protein
MLRLVLPSFPAGVLFILVLVDVVIVVVVVLAVASVSGWRSVVDFIT